MDQSLPIAYRRIGESRGEAMSYTRASAPYSGSSGRLFADSFTIPLSDDWKNDTVYILKGPTKKGRPQSVRITVDVEAGSVTVVDYADVQIRRQRQARPEAQFLFKKLTSLDNDLPAYWAVSQWSPRENQVYLQHACFVVQGGIGYRLSASFQKQVRATVEPTVVRLIQTFEPHLPVRARQ